MNWWHWWHCGHSGATSAISTSPSFLVLVSFSGFFASVTAASSAGDTERDQSRGATPGVPSGATPGVRCVPPPLTPLGRSPQPLQLLPAPLPPERDRSRRDRHRPAPQTPGTPISHRGHQRTPGGGRGGRRSPPLLPPPPRQLPPPLEKLLAQLLREQRGHRWRPGVTGAPSPNPPVPVTGTTVRNGTRATPGALPPAGTLPNPSCTPGTLGDPPVTVRGRLILPPIPIASPRGFRSGRTSGHFTPPLYPAPLILLVLEREGVPDWLQMREPRPYYNNIEYLIRCPPPSPLKGFNWLESARRRL